MKDERRTVIKRARIIKSSSPHFWYAKHIGKPITIRMDLNLDYKDVRWIHGKKGESFEKIDLEFLPFRPRRKPPGRLLIKGGVVTPNDKPLTTSDFIKPRN